ncbi:MAG: hypothetical protein KJ630_00215, partial [Proteobacteria bacterium]|nr:hypothetical protein [Pseudomonadota bacterium]
HKMLVLAINFLLVVALFIAMYRASLFPEDFNATFFTTIFSLLIPTLVFGYLGKRYLRIRQNIVSYDVPQQSTLSHDI